MDKNKFIFMYCCIVKMQILYLSDFYISPMFITVDLRYFTYNVYLCV